MADQQTDDQAAGKNSQLTAGQQGQSSEYGPQGAENAPGPDEVGPGIADDSTISGASDARSSGNAEADREEDERRRHTTSNIGAPSLGTSQTSGGSSGVAGGKGFIGSQADDSASND